MNDREKLRELIKELKPTLSDSDLEQIAKRLSSWRVKRNPQYVAARLKKAKAALTELTEAERHCEALRDVGLDELADHLAAVIDEAREASAKIASHPLAQKMRGRYKKEEAFSAFHKILDVFKEITKEDLDFGMSKNKKNTKERTTGGSSTEGTGGKTKYGGYFYRLFKHFLAMHNIDGTAHSVIEKMKEQRPK